MPGFETVVRPVVCPNIRPAPAQPLRPPKDDSDKGFAVLKSSAGNAYSLSQSYSASTSSSQRSETKRQVDVVRVYQKSGDGTGSSRSGSGEVNKDNYVDIEVVKKAWMKGPPYGTVNNSGPGYGDPGFGSPGIGGTAPEKILDIYRRVEETDNIEILERDVIRYRE
jgi:hypothetical protein